MYATNTDKTDKLQRSILGSIILEPRSFFDVSTILQPGMFSGWLGGVAYELWEQLEDTGDVSVNALALDAESKHQIEQSSVYNLIQFANPGSLIKDAQKLKAEFIRKQEIQLAEKSLTRFRNGEEVEKVLADIQTERELLNDFNGDHNESRVQQVMGWMDSILDAKTGKKMGGIQIPFPTINDMFGGLHLTNYSLWGARPGAGKTTVLLDLIMCAIENKIPSLFFSLEMSYNEILSILAQKKTGVSRKLMRSGQVDELQLKRLKAFMEQFYELPIYIETGVYDLGDLKHKSRMYSKKYGVKLIAIDYIQLLGVRGFRGQRNTEVETISRALKRMISEKDCNAHLIALSQLSRAVESRATKRPALSDLRDSGSLEQDADNICFVYRPDYYGIEEDEEGNKIKGLVEFIVAKNRHVSDALGTVYLQYSAINNDYKELPQNEFVEDEEKVNAIFPIKPSRVNDDEDIPY